MTTATPDLIGAFEATFGTYRPTPPHVITADQQARIDQDEARAEDKATDMYVDRWQEQAWQNRVEMDMDRRGGSL